MLRSELDALLGDIRERKATIRRVDILGGIDVAEEISAWKTDALAKIETLPALTRATVKTLLGIK